MSQVNTISATLGGLAAVGVAVGAYVLYGKKASSPPSCCASSKASADSSAVLNPKEWDNAKIYKKFEATFPELVSQFNAYARNVHELPEHAIARLEKLFNYNCLGGKMNRGLITCWTTRDICAAKNLPFTEKTLYNAIVLGWCIEILQACFLVADDIMDHSITRRGQPCWYRVPEVQMDAVNDTLILESFIYFLLKEHFGQSSIYVPLLELYHEVSFQTQMGQMLDLMSQPLGQKNPEILKRFNSTLQKQIVRYKTAYYSFYLPFAGGMILTGLSSPKQLKVAQKISVELGEKFQIQDDFLDCFGDPNLIGKHGTDIQDHKCTWLVVQALDRVNPQQRQLLESLYGKEDEASVQKVKQLYVDLGLKDVFDKQEEDSYARIVKLIQDNKDIIPPTIFEDVLKKIHRREK